MAEFKGNNNKQIWETMGFNYTTGVATTPKNRQGLGNAITRDNGLPLDLSMLHATYADAVVYAATKSIAYVDQILAAEGIVYIVTDESQGKLTVSSYRDSLTGAIINLETPTEYDVFLKPVGVIPTGDNFSISVTEDGEISIVGADDADAKQILRINANGDGVEWVKAADVVTVAKDETATGVAARYQVKVDGVASGVNIDVPYDARLAGIDHDSTVAAYVANAVASAGHLKRVIVEALPTENIDLDTIYMVAAPETATGDIYAEYMYINGAWEKIGDTQTSLAGYVTEENLERTLEDYYTAEEIDNRFATHEEEAGNYYASKAELGELADEVGELSESLANDYYTREEVLATFGTHEAAADAKYATKANTYNKGEIDDIVSEITGSSAGTSAQVQANLDAYARANDTELYGAEEVNKLNPEDAESYDSPSNHSNIKSRIDLAEEAIADLQEMDNDFSEDIANHEERISALEEAVEGIQGDLGNKLEEIHVADDLAGLLKITNKDTIADDGLVKKLSDLTDSVNTANSTANTNKANIEAIVGRVDGHDTKLIELEAWHTQHHNDYAALELRVAALDGEGGSIAALQKAIADEATAREDADTALGQRIDSIYHSYYSEELGKIVETGTLVNKFDSVNAKATNNALAIQDLRDTVGNLTNVMNFRGAVTPSAGFTDPNLDTDAIATLGEIENGDVIVYGDLEYVYDASKAETHRWVEFGNATANAAAIAALQETVADHGLAISTLTSGLDNVVNVELPKIPGLIGDAVEAHSKVMANFDGTTYYAGHVMSDEKAVFVEGKLTAVSTDLLVNGATELILNGGNAAGAAN